MEAAEIQERVMKILAPYVKEPDALAKATTETSILDDLRVNSARLVDVVLAFEDDFDIEIADEDLDSVNTIGDCVKLIGERV